MTKFDEVVNCILEADASSGEQATNYNFVQALVKEMERVGNEPLADALEKQILKNQKFQNILNVPPDSPERKSQLIDMLNAVVATLKDVSMDASVDDDPYKRRPGYFGTRIGRYRGDYIRHGDLEKAFRDTMVDFNQGNLLKKAGMIRRGLKYMFAPTHSAGTGIFSK